MTGPRWTIARLMAVVLLIALGLAALINNARNIGQIAKLSARITQMEADASRKQNTLVTIIAEMRERLANSGNAIELPGGHQSKGDHLPIRFALVGKIDVNGDGNDDRIEVKRMIKDSGGIIAFDLPPPEVGEETGKLTSRIDWYVIDDRTPLRDAPPSRSAQSLPEQAKIERRMGEVVKEARLNGIRPLRLGQWWTDRKPQTTVPSGERR
jgi:hypothetical protein